MSLTACIQLGLLGKTIFFCIVVHPIHLSFKHPLYVPVYQLRWRANVSVTHTIIFIFVRTILYCEIYFEAIEFSVLHVEIFYYSISSYLCMYLRTAKTRPQVYKHLQTQAVASEMLATCLRVTSTLDLRIQGHKSNRRFGTLKDLAFLFGARY